MTPEQKFLKALAEMYQNGYKESDIEKEAVGYLSSLNHLLGGTEKVSKPAQPSWTPEVGKLYKGEHGTYEVIEVYEYGCKFHVIEAGCNSTLGSKTDEYKGLTPIAELEGLNEGDKIWSISQNKNPISFTIFTNAIVNILWARLQDMEIPVKLDGSLPLIGNGQQLFYRSEERAERFGRGEG